MKVLGVDPGLTGALALLDSGSGRLLCLADLPVAAGRVKAGALADLLAEWSPDAAVIEAVRARPGQGVTSMFTFGRGYGCIEGVVEALRIPLYEITPAVWKRHIGVGKDKGVCRAEAERRWPTWRASFKRVRDDGRAEAALIAAAWMERSAFA